MSIFFTIPLRFPSISKIAPEVSSGTHITTFSIGSCFFPSISWKITCGEPTCNSNPSRRIVSTNTDKCNSPRPETLYEFPSEFSKSILRPTFISVSFSRRSRIWREVTNFPSFPANGESFTKNSIVKVGSSIVIAGIGSAFGSATIVSPT